MTPNFDAVETLRVQTEAYVVGHVFYIIPFALIVVFMNEIFKEYIKIKGYPQYYANHLDIFLKSSAAIWILVGFIMFGLLWEFVLRKSVGILEDLLILWVIATFVTITYFFVSGTKIGANVIQGQNRLDQFFGVYFIFLFSILLLYGLSGALLYIFMLPS